MNDTLAKIIREMEDESSDLAVLSDNDNHNAQVAAKSIEQWAQRLTALAVPPAPTADSLSVFKRKAVQRGGRPDEAYAPASAEPPRCNWHLDDNDDASHYETSCGKAWEFTTDGVKENGLKFCCFCGKSIWESKTSDAATLPEGDPK